MATAPSAARAYLDDRMLQLGGAGECSQWSPFEVRSGSPRLSALSEVDALDETVFTQLAAWCRTRSDAIAWIVYAVDLVVAGHEWRRCLRWLSDDGGAQQPPGQPVVLVRAGRAPDRPDAVELMVYSTAPTWLRGAVGLGPTIMATGDADENLARLASVCGALARGQPGLISAELTLDGRAFVEQRTRIRAALEDAVGCPLE